LETPIWHQKSALDAFWDFEIPQGLVEGYGYPQLTETAKRKILGENLLRLSGMNVEETRTRLAGAHDRWHAPGVHREPPTYWMTFPAFIDPRWTSSIL
jgi:hypothetical protein